MNENQNFQEEPTGGMSREQAADIAVERRNAIRVFSLVYIFVILTVVIRLVSPVWFMYLPLGVLMYLIDFWACAVADHLYKSLGGKPNRVSRLIAIVIPVLSGFYLARVLKASKTVLTGSEA